MNNLNAREQECQVKITIQKEAASPLIEEIDPLLREHAKEISHFKDIPFDPDYKKYIAMDEIGLLRCFTARLDGRLVGYLIYLVHPNLHYKTSLQAVQDVFYVEPDRRGAMLGIKLLRFSEKELREEGVQVEYQHMKEKHSFAPMLKREGFELVDLVFARRLDK